MNSTVRWILVVAGAAGVLFSSVGFIDIIQVIRSNGVTDGEAVGLREHYLQLGQFYARGFTTGFFLCFSLMLVAVAAGTYYDERRKRMRARMAVAGIMARSVEEGAFLADSDDDDSPASSTH